MHKKVFFNGDPAIANDPSIYALSNGALYGKGVFTTVRVRTGKPLFWDKHSRRLIGNASKLGIDLTKFPENMIVEELYDLIDSNEMLDVPIRQNDEPVDHDR